MSNKLSVAERFYAPITAGETSGIEDWEPEDFNPTTKYLIYLFIERGRSKPRRDLGLVISIII